MSWGVALRNAVGLGLGGIPSLLNAPPYAKLAFNFLSGELDPRITFSRTSNATLIGSDGTLQYAPHNLLTYSEQFDNAAWTKTSLTVTANTTEAPNGTTTAELLVLSAGLSTKSVEQSVTTGAQEYSFSVFIKSNGHQFVQMRSGAAISAGFVNFDVVNGVVGTQATWTGSITSVGNGWFRLSCNTGVVSAAASVFVIQPVASNAAGRNETVNGDGVSGIYTWGAQLNVEALQPYYQTEASAYYGPRFDYDPVTLAPKGLLIEEQRTNLAINSGDVLSGGTGGVVVADQITAPDGSLADFFQEDTGSNEHYAGDRAPSVTAGTTYTWSFYAKLGLTGEARRVCVRTGGQGPANVIFDLETVSSTVIAPVVSSGISSAGNGWFRCWIVYTATGTGVAVFRQQLAKGANTVYTGDGTSGLFFWGAQVEVGAFPTSYIPTTTAAATRAADVASVTGANFSNWYNSVEGTTLVEAATLPNVTATVITYAISDGTFNQSIYGNFSSGNAYRGANVLDGGVGQASSIASFAGLTTTNNTKDALAYKANDFAESCNGVATRTDTAGTVPAVNRLYIGSSWAGSGNFLNGHIRSFKYYPTRLSNGQLQALTK